MKRIFVVACSLSFAALAQTDQAVVRGQLTFNSGGIGQVAECGTHRVIEFGTMASSPYFLLIRGYDELSGDGKNAVLVEAAQQCAAADVRNARA